MKIEESEATFAINTIGERTNTTYMGNFKVKCLLSPMEEIDADKLYRNLLGANSHLAQERVRTVAFALSQLSVRITGEIPPFWQNNVLGGAHVTDNNVILEILDLAIEAQSKYIEDKKKEMKDRQKALTAMMKKGTIEKEPDIEAVTAEEFDEEVEKEIDLAD